VYKYGIVVIAYKYPHRLERLLKQLNNAIYQKERVSLIISIDYSENSVVNELARKFVWKHGKKIVREYKERQGLRKHILSCGRYMEEYNLDAIAVFEDDTYPAEDYYLYMKAATEMYYEDDNIAGISFYTHSKNINADSVFYPLVRDKDAFFLKYPQSWGQVWLRKQWNEFQEWYDKNNGEILYSENIPENIYLWGDNSWLKYHIKYCIENNKYFVYPYVAHSTCFNECGEHTIDENNIYQVSLSQQTSKEYRFPKFSEEELKYDAFFENEELYKACKVKKEELLVDLYGMRHGKVGKRYLLSSKRLNYPIKKSWGNKLKPHELNIIYDIEGEDFFLYDMAGNEMRVISSKEKKKDKFQIYFNVMNQWLQVYENHSFKNMKNYFDNKGILTVAIYGYGVMGKHLHKVLSQLGIEVQYIIDKNVKEEDCELPVVRPHDKMDYVDAVIVSLVAEFADIECILKKNYGGHIVSIEEI